MNSIFICLDLKNALKIILFFALIIFPSCFGRYIYTDKEIEEHYAHKKLKPDFRFFQYKEKKIFHVVSGDSSKPLLILIHGSPGAWYGYMNMIDDSLIQANFRIIALDRLGYFKSRNGGAEVSVEEQASSIMALIKYYNKDKMPYYLFGRSYGAPIGAYIAAHDNAMVRHLYMISPAMDPSTEKFFWFSGLGRWKLIRFFLPKALNTATDEKYAHIEEMRKLNAILPTITCSTTVVTGTADWIADTTNFDYCKRELIQAKAQFIKLRNVGHLINYERPLFIQQLILGDLSKD